MKKNQKNKIIKYFKLTVIISIIILVSYSQIFDTRNVSSSGNKLSLRDIWILFIYIFGMILIPFIVYCITKFRKEKY